MTGRHFPDHGSMWQSPILVKVSFSSFPHFPRPFLLQLADTAEGGFFGAVRCHIEIGNIFYPPHMRIVSFLSCFNGIACFFKWAVIVEEIFEQCRGFNNFHWAVDIFNTSVLQCDRGVFPDSGVSWAFRAFRFHIFWAWTELNWFELSWIGLNWVE